MNEPGPSHKLLLVDEAGRVIDVFQINRYDLSRFGGQELLASDILDATGRSPSDWAVRPDIAVEVIDALEVALSILKDIKPDRNDLSRCQSAILKVTVALRKTRVLSAFVPLSPDPQRNA